MAFTDEELQKIRKRLGTEDANAQPPIRRRRRVGKLLLLVLLSGLMALPAFMLWHYGTFRPCGALTQAMHGALLGEAASRATMPAEMLGLEASPQVLFPVVDRRIAAMSPGECTKALARFETSGENPFPDLFSAPPTP